jgi:hypothetical protein
MPKTAILKLLVFLAMSTLSLAAFSEEVGTSCEDCPSYRGAFSIENNSGATIHYEYRWGDNHSWQRMTLHSGRVETHWYALGSDPHKKVPTPYVRFDRIGGDKGVTLKEYRMQFHAVGYAGYGAPRNETKPKRYAFRYAPNGRDLDLVAE